MIVVMFIDLPPAGNTCFTMEKLQCIIRNVNFRILIKNIIIKIILFYSHTRTHIHTMILQLSHFLIFQSNIYIIIHEKLF